MLLDGRTIIDKKLVVFNDEYPLVDTEDQIQPNGVDLRINCIYSVSGIAQVPREGKVNASGFSVYQMQPKEGWWQLDPRYSKLYFVDFLETVDVKDGYSAHLHTRSSLTRSGIDIMAGLYDTGFQGRAGGTIRLHNPVTIEWGAKICQILFNESKFNGHRYSGRYQNTNSETAITST